MRKGILLAIGAFSLACSVPALQAQDQKPQTPKQDLHSTLNQLENVSRTLHASEEAAIAADPALQAERQTLLDEVEQTVEKIKAFEQKVDDKVVEKSPDSKPLVQEKRDLLAKVEDQTPGKKGAAFGLGRLLKFLSGEKAPGHDKAERHGKGASRRKGGAAE